MAMGEWKVWETTSKKRTTGVTQGSFHLLPRELLLHEALSAQNCVSRGGKQKEDPEQTQVFMVSYGSDLIIYSL